MTESKVKRENYIVIQGFMIKDLQLKGNELLIYAIIYGFSQAENQKFSGSLQYLADWTNSTKQSVMKCLKSLTEKGLIEKKDNIINGVKFCEYHTTKFNEVLNKVVYPIQQSLMGGIQQSLPNNINNNINKKERKKESGYDVILSDITNESLKELYYEYIKMRKLIKSPLTDRALKMLIEKVNKLEPTSIDRQKQLLETAILNNWKSVYPLKEPTGGNNNGDKGRNRQNESQNERRNEFTPKANNSWDL